MPVVVIEPPEPLVELELAKQHLRVDGDDSDQLIRAYIAAVSEHIDGPEGWLGRSVGAQQLELQTDALSGSVLLPYGPILAVESVAYIDLSGAGATLPADAYVLDAGEISPAFGGSWPDVRRDSVRIRYRAGYAAPPKPIVVATLLIVGELYQGREDSSAEIPIDGPAAALLNPYRCWWP